MDSRYGFLAMAVNLLALCWSWGAMAADPDPLQDYCVADMAAMNSIFINGLPCKSADLVTALDFKSTILKSPGNTTNPSGVAVTVASAMVFGGLNTQGLSFTRVDYAPGGLLPPHIHPRASELLYVAQGTLTAGFVDTNNTLFTETLEVGELFVIPRGLVHFVMNAGDTPALTFGGLNSQNPGASLLAPAMFGSKPPFPDVVLQKTFQLSQDEIDRLRASFGTTA